MGKSGDFRPEKQSVACDDFVDLLPPADTDKLDWTTSVQGVSDYAVPLNLKGALYDRLWLRFGREQAKHLTRRLCPGAANLLRRLRLRG